MIRATGILAAKAYARSVLNSAGQPMPCTTKATTDARLMTIMVATFGVFETKNEQTTPAIVIAIPTTGIKMARAALAGPSPAAASLAAKYTPKTMGSQDIPTSAPPPPGLGSKYFGDQCSSSPTRRSTVIASVITEGQSISWPM